MVQPVSSDSPVEESIGPAPARVRGGAARTRACVSRRARKGPVSLKLERPSPSCRVLSDAGAAAAAAATRRLLSGW